MVKTLSVAAIKDGTVIDHIPIGAAIIILQLLKVLTKHHRISLGLNLSSTSMGLKDIFDPKLKIGSSTEKEAHDIAVFAPKSTISIIKDYKLISKIKAKLPLLVERILVCPNERCITRSEPMTTLFHVRSSISCRCI